MNAFLLDVWHDLRQKRLWPVALGAFRSRVRLGRRCRGRLRRAVERGIGVRRLERDARRRLDRVREHGQHVRWWRTRRGRCPGRRGSPSGGGAPPPKQEKFTYEVDVDFGPRGSVRDFDGVATLHPLTEANPRLLFLGVADDAKRAAFSVLDTEVEERGDGECLEFDDRCAVLYLKVGEKHTFVEPDRDRYEIRLRAINEVRL